MIPKPDPSAWWCFVPLIGLQLTDAPADPLRRPLWGDCTILPGTAIIQLAQQISTPGERPWSPNVHPDGTYLGVVRRTTLNTAWWDEEQGNEAEIQSIRARAGQVAAALTVGLLALSPEGQVCGLLDQHHQVNEALVLMNFQSADGLAITGHGPRVDTFDRAAADDLCFSYDNLQEHLAAPAIQSLLMTVAPQRARMAASLRESIIQACVRLAHAIHAATYTDQVLGVITCLELLLSDPGRRMSFDQKMQRLEPLLGQQLLRRYHLADILQARHLYVHEGAVVKTRELPVQAIGLGIAALCSMATLAQQFQDKVSLLTYLDVVGLTSRTQDDWAQPVLTTLQPHLDALPPADSLPIWQYVDGTLAFDADFRAGLFDRSDRVFERPETSQDETP